MSSPRWSTCVAVLGVWILALPSRAAEDAQDFLLLSAHEPIVLRLQLLVDGQPAAAIRGRYLDLLFTDLDRDRDGFLSKVEAARAPSVAFLQSFLNGGIAADAKENVAPFEQLDSERAGRVSRQAFDAYYRRAGLELVRLNVAPTDQEAALLTDALFRLLDLDGDGKLSRAELNQAAESVRAVDFNDDEWITPDELLTLSKKVAPRPKPQGPALLRRDPDAAETVTTAVRKRYGTFDETALAALWRRPPDVDVQVRLETRRVPLTAGTLRRPEGLNPGRRMRLPGRDMYVTSAGALMRLALGKFGNLDCDIDTAESPDKSVSRVHQLIRQQFQANGTGFLTRQQAEESDLLAGLFHLADRDGDGKLTEQELHSFLDLHALGSVSFTTITLADRSPSLFDLLDADADGRLSLRELATAWERLGFYDRDGDGLLARGELPERLQLYLVPGTSSPRTPPTRMAHPKPAAARGPAWFRKMDRNADGYVSRREWLGSEELFRRLDVDGDGLISAEEADALDRPAHSDKRGP